MKNFIICTIFFIFSSNLFAQDQGRSNLVIPNKIFDFGSVSEGTIIKHEFKITNSGNADAMIQDIITSCGCTASVASSKKIAPQKSESISVQFDTTGFKGNQKKEVLVMTNDLDENQINFVLKGNITPEIKIEPTRVFLGNIAQSELLNFIPYKVKIEILEKGVEIKKILSLSKYLQVEINKLNDKETELEIKISKDLPIGELRDRVIVELVGAKRKSINIPIYINVTGDLKITPQAIAFGVIEEDRIEKRVVKIDNVGSEDFDIEKIEIAHPSLTSNLKTVNKGRNYLLEVTLDSSKIESELRSEIIVYTNNDKYQKIIINVYGVLPPNKLK